MFIRAFCKEKIILRNIIQNGFQMKSREIGYNKSQYILFNSSNNFLSKNINFHDNKDIYTPILLNSKLGLMGNIVDSYDNILGGEYMYSKKTEKDEIKEIKEIIEKDEEAKSILDNISMTFSGLKKYIPDQNTIKDNVSENSIIKNFNKYVLDQKNVKNLVPKQEQFLDLLTNTKDSITEQFSKFYNSTIDDKLILIQSSNINDEEVTLYVKGFLSKGENPNRFEEWLNSHNNLVTTKKWGKRMYGWQWQSGSVKKIGEIPIPAASITHLTYGLVKYMNLITKPMKLIPTPQTLLYVAANEMLFFGGQIYMEYRNAHSHIKEHSHILAKNIIELRQKYSKVRIVAHSLGCKLLLSSLQEVKPEYRPDEIYLCAPAAIEKECSHILDNLAKDQSYLFYCERDLVLSTVYRMMHIGADAMGCVGVSKDYKKLTPIDLEDKFGFFVHSRYREDFDKFVP